MNRASKNIWKKITSMAIVAAGGTVVFAGLSIYQGNERFYREVFLPGMHYFFEPEQAHTLAIKTAQWGLIPQSKFQENSVLETKLWDLKFKNPIGIAAGFDKNGEAVSGLFKTGIGFLEVGSVTPNAQDGNPKPRIFRLEEDEAIINRCGFNSKGHEFVKMRLEFFDKTKGVIGVNLGKNKLSNSAENDYVQGVKEFGRIADYLVVNISSPNTPGLRSLQKSGALESLLDKVIEARNGLNKTMLKIPVQNMGGDGLDNGSKQYKDVRPPILVKIAPDLSHEEKKDIAKAVLRKGKEIDGLIVCNTSISRPKNLCSSKKDETGGLSGKPLSSMSVATIRDMYQLTNGQIPIIGVGGVSSGMDAYEKIRAGASLIQLYTALIYGGPPLINKIKKELQELLLADGYSNVAEAVGADHRKS